MTATATRPRETAEPALSGPEQWIVATALREGGRKAESLLADYERNHEARGAVVRQVFTRRRGF